LKWFLLDQNSEITNAFIYDVTAKPQSIFSNHTFFVQTIVHCSLFVIYRSSVSQYPSLKVSSQGAEVLSNYQTVKLPNRQITKSPSHQITPSQGLSFALSLSRLIVSAGAWNSGQEGGGHPFPGRCPGLPILCPSGATADNETLRLSMYRSVVLIIRFEHRCNEQRKGPKRGCFLSRFLRI
jgi:hypothetical protein